MKHLLYIIIITLTATQYTHAQSDDLQKQINEQVWKPFITSLNNRDDAGFSAVHSKEVTRINQDSKEIYGYDVYFKKIPDSIKARWAAWKNSIELRFIQRIAAGDRAFEVGYYKTTSTNSTTGEKSIKYGKFHVLLRKESGTWKILMDADANEKTTEAIFNSAQPLE
jgi:ketosteroid isomerase-like protein